MKSSTYSQDCENISTLLELSKKKEIEIEIHIKEGSTFCLTTKKQAGFRQILSNLLAIVQKGEIRIRRKDDGSYSLIQKKQKAASPFDIPGIKTKATTQDILESVRDSRMR